MTENKLFIDSLDLEDYETIQLQAEKIKVADLLQEYEEIESPQAYHKLAYRYKLDEIIDTLADYYEIVAAIAQKTADLAQSFNRTSLPPYIQARLTAIMTEQEKIDPNMSEIKRGVIFDALFAPGGEFDGLYKENSLEIDNDWLANYAEKCEQEKKPIEIKIEFTNEMLEDIGLIEKEDISNEEKDTKIRSLFAEGGKYEDALQAAYEKEVELYNSQNA